MLLEVSYIILEAIIPDILYHTKVNKILLFQTNDVCSHVAHQVTPCVNHDHPKGHFVINDHPETARAEGQIVPQAKFFRIMVSKRAFYLPELIIFLIRNHQVMHEIPPGDAERPLRHLWLRGWATSTTLQTGNVCNSIYIIW